MIYKTWNHLNLKYLNKLLISIIIPNYNRVELIEETINSIKNQNVQNWECIIVDDGSTDESMKVISEIIGNVIM